MSSLITVAVVGAAVSAHNANDAKHAQEDATRAVQTAEEKALAQQDRHYEQTREDWAPWRATGENSLANIDAVNSGDMSAFQTSPGYQFRMDEGTRNTENAFSVKGGGGNAMRALAEFSQNMASNEFGSWYDRQLSGAGLGTTGNVYSQQAGANRANQNQNSLWRSGENQAGIGLYGAREQAGYMNDAWGSLMGGMKGFAGRGG